MVGAVVVDDSFTLLTLTDPIYRKRKIAILEK
jgi:hypothetical protein